MSFVAERLRKHTSDLAELFSGRIQGLRNRRELASCIRCLDTSSAGSCFFEPGDYIAVGIDGSMDYDELLEMLLFYVCASGFKCDFSVGEKIRFRLDDVVRDSRLSASASVPLWTEDLFFVAEESGSTEQDIARSAERIPYALMAMSELYLALKAIENPEVRLLFLDRPLHGTFGPLSRDLRLFLRRKKSVLFGMETSYGRLTLLDFSLASVLGSGWNWVSNRTQYLPFVAVQRLFQGDQSFEDLRKNLGVSRVSGKRLLKRLQRMHEASGNILFKDNVDFDIEDPVLRLNEDVKDYWFRVKEASLSVAEKIFNSAEHPLMLGEGESWLTVLDMNTVNVMLIHILREEALRQKILVIGIAKDTSASDYIRAAIPYAKELGIIPKEVRLPNLRHDRAFLTILSSTNPDFFKTPWRTISYDTCFTTLVEGDEKHVLRAARRVVSMERQFVKSYFQLREFKSDPEVRSPTFLYDRFYNPEFDDRFISEMTVFERGKESVIYPYWEGGSENPLDTFILYVLSECDNPEVLEAIGHNQLLYLADKAVKTEVKLMKSMLRGVADLELGSLSRKQKIFTIARRFRDIRRETEGARERAKLEEASF
ncbi:MAG: DNA double-strand break repair nuclease NurA [Candidatus Bathyarchaeia archaeon]